MESNGGAGVHIIGRCTGGGDRPVRLYAAASLNVFDHVRGSGSGESFLARNDILDVHGRSLVSDMQLPTLSCRPLKKLTVAFGCVAMQLQSGV